ncbi:MAG: NADH-quinone oxidoreductase subunit H [Candidatus Nitrosocosmicus sp.]
MLFYFFFILLATGFLTLMEHLLIGVVHQRQGPNKILFFGFFQPIFDGFKLFQKEFLFFGFYFLIIYLGFSLVKFFISLVFFFIFLFSDKIKIIFLFLFIFITLILFFFLLLSFFSKSKYSVLGSLRLVSQTLSCELDFIFFFFIFLFFFKGIIILKNFGFIFFIFFFIIFFILRVVEVNRAPFDFAEGERELVRG